MHRYLRIPSTFSRNAILSEEIKLRMVAIGMKEKARLELTDGHIDCCTWERHNAILSAIPRKDHPRCDCDQNF